MSPIKTISVQQICTFYNVPDSFIDSLLEYDLIEVVQVNDGRHIRENQIRDIEKLIRLHYDLNINFEGLDVVNNLMHQIEDLQHEVTELRNRLAFYEDGE